MPPSTSKPTDFGAYNTDPHDADPFARPQTYRRDSTMIFGWIFVAVFALIGLYVGIRQITHGLDGVATIFSTIFLIVVAMIVSVWPHVVLRQDGLEVHNSIFWIDVPYISISEIKPTRLGLVVRTYSGKLVAVAAYASGSGKKVLGHTDAADELIRAVEERTAFVDDSAWRDAPPPQRHVEWRNLIALLATAVVAGVLIALAVAR